MRRLALAAAGCALAAHASSVAAAPHAAPPARPPPTDRPPDPPADPAVTPPTVPARAPAPADERDASSEVIEIHDARAPAADRASARVIDQEVIRTTPKRSVDDLLRLIPGLHTVQHGSEGKGLQLFLRGFDAVHGADVEVRVAGMPINEMGNVHGQGYVDLGMVMPEVVRSLEAHKGSAGLEQGNFATAGSLALELGVEERGQRSGYEVGSTNRHRVWAVIAPDAQPAAAFTALEAMRDDGYGNNRAARRISAITQQRLESADGERAIEVMAVAYAARFGEPGVTPAADVERGVLGPRETWDDVSEGRVERLRLGGRGELTDGPLRLTARLGGAVGDLALSENYTGFLQDPVRGDLRLQRHRSRMIGGEVAGERALGDAVALVAGIEGLVDAIEQSEERLDLDGRAWRTDRDLTAIQTLGGVRAGVRIHAGRLRVEAGGRLDVLHLSANDRLAAVRGDATLVTASPRVASSFAIGEALRGFAAYGRGLRAPEPAAVTRVVDPDVDVTHVPADEAHVTTSDSVEVGAAWRRPRRLALQASLFGIWISDESVFDHAAGTTLALNRSRRLGLELGAEAWPRPWLRLRGDLSATDARFVASGAPVPAVPTVYGTLEAGALHPSGWRTGAELFYLAPRELAHGATGGAGAVLGLLVGRAFAVDRAGPLSGWDVELSLDNVLGSDLAEGEYHFASWFDTRQPRSNLPRLHYAAGRPFGARLALTAHF